MKIPWTKEHGAYGMAITTFVIGTGIGGNATIYSILLLLSIIFLIMAKSPISILMQGRKVDNSTKRRFILWGFAFTNAGFLLLLPLFRVIPRDLSIFLVIIIIIHVLVYFTSVLLRKERGLFSEIAGISMICIAGVIGYLSSGGVDIKFAILIWFVSLLYFSASIFKVRSIIDKNRKELYRTLNLLYPLFCLLIIFLLASNKLIPWVVSLCLLPLFENILLNFKEAKIDIRKTGWIEVLKSAVFGVILIVTMR